MTESCRNRRLELMSRMAASAAKRPDKTKFLLGLVLLDLLTQGLIPHPAPHPLPKRFLKHRIARQIAVRKLQPLPRCGQRLLQRHQCGAAANAGHGHAHRVAVAAGRDAAR